MKCTDCHSLDEIHGTGELPTSPVTGVKVTCQSCHVNGDHPAVLKQPDGTMTLLRGAGRTIPAWDGSRIPHRVDAHRDKLRCSACHAAWSFQDYGLHLMLEERADYWKWAPTAAQNDPQVQDLLMRNIGTFAEVVPPADGQVPARQEEQWELPSMKDWLTGETRRGAWFRGYTVRRWSQPPLGRDHKGRVSIMRPMYQYVVSHVDSDANLLLDRLIPTTGGGFPALIFNPYEPHTTTKKGRTCHQCHGNPKAVGLGEGMRGIEKPGFYPIWRPEEGIPGHSFRWDALCDDKGTPLQRSSHPNAGPLDPDTVQRLLNPSDAHRGLWRRYLEP